MNRTLRLTVIMAILGFILGLGFLVPIPSPEGRDPASVELEKDAVAFVEPKREPAPLPEPRDLELSRNAVTLGGETLVDRRSDVIFDVHTISRSAYAKDTDAYVTVRFRYGGREEIQNFTYCHNYDYSRQRANTKLSRYSLGTDAFNCYTIYLSELASPGGYVLIDTPLGEVLTLRSQPGFDPRRGGRISVIFAYKVAKIGRNDYRVFDIGLSLANGVVKVTGPKGEYFDWFNLKMTEDIFGLPNGVNVFELYARGAKVSEHPGKTFPKAPRIVKAK